MKRIILAGGSGFLGTILANHFQMAGNATTILTRAPALTAIGSRRIFWDGISLGDWASELEGAWAVINLAGRSVNCRYHERNRKLILESRVEATRVLGQAIAKCKVPPAVWLNASTATIYRHTFGPAWDESGEVAGTPEVRDEFSVAVATAWERAFNECPAPHTRKVALRAALVLGTGRNSVFPMLRRLARIGLGGRMGNGRQFVSWIYQEDFCRAVEWLISHDPFEGPVNLSAPNPLPNAEMMKILREICGVPFGLPATQWMLEVGAFLLRTETELILKSRRVVPRRLIESGFTFRFPCLREAIQDLHTKSR